MRLSRRDALFACCLLALAAGCSRDPAKTVFSGTWTAMAENAIMSQSETETYEVIADKDRFRITTRGPDTESIDVFDGETLFTRYTALPSADVDEAGEPASGLGATPVPATVSPTSSQKISKEQAAAMRFWVPLTAGDSKPGGEIAGRETLLFEARERRPDGEISLQRWIDSETGVLLKSVDAVYSSQVDSLVTRNTRECRRIEFGPVDPVAFKAP